MHSFFDPEKYNKVDNYLDRKNIRLIKYRSSPGAIFNLQEKIKIFNDSLVFKVKMSFNFDNYLNFIDTLE